VLVVGSGLSSEGGGPEDEKARNSQILEDFPYLPTFILDIGQYPSTESRKKRSRRAVRIVIMVECFSCSSME
jgi:hypothetical protein